MTARTAEASSVPEPFGRPGGPGLFHKKGLQLPPYIQHVAHELVKKGKSESQAIQMAIGIVKNWAEGKGGVHPDVRAAAVAAVAAWEKAKAETKLSNPNGTIVLDLAGPKGYVHGWIKVGMTVAHKDGSYGVVRNYDPNTQTAKVDWFHGPRVGKVNKTTTKAYHVSDTPSNYLGSEASKKDPTIGRTPEERAVVERGGDVEAFRSSQQNQTWLEQLKKAQETSMSPTERFKQDREVRKSTQPLVVHTATYKGMTETRTSKATYTHAAVYRLRNPDGSPREVIGSFHQSEAAARKGSSGLHPIAVVPVKRSAK